MFCRQAFDCVLSRAQPRRFVCDSASLGCCEGGVCTRCSTFAMAESIDQTVRQVAVEEALPYRLDLLWVI